MSNGEEAITHEAHFKHLATPAQINKFELETLIREKYKPGDKIISCNSNVMCTIAGPLNISVYVNDDWATVGSIPSDWDYKYLNPFVYYKGKWAEIVKDEKVSNPVGNALKDCNQQWEREVDALIEKYQWTTFAPLGKSFISDLKSLKGEIN